MENEVKKFFDFYAMREWERLDHDGYSRINFMLHMDFIKSSLFEGAKVLDAGCGAGRFSIEFAKLGCMVTMLDISDIQLDIAKQKIEDHGYQDRIEAYIEGDIRNLSMFEDDSFDFIVCYGAPLSYITEDRDKALFEFHRVLKPNGKIFASVNNKWGILKTLLGNGYPDFFQRPDYWYISMVMETGNLPRHEMVEHPPRHFFEAEELKSEFESSGFHDTQLAASPCISCGAMKYVNELANDETALRVIKEIELKTYRKETMLDNGEFLLICGTK